MGLMGWQIAGMKVGIFLTPSTRSANINILISPEYYFSSYFTLSKPKNAYKALYYKSTLSTMQFQEFSGWELMQSWNLRKFINIILQLWQAGGLKCTRSQAKSRTPVGWPHIAYCGRCRSRARDWAIACKWAITTNPSKSHESLINQALQLNLKVKLTLRLSVKRCKRMLGDASLNTQVAEPPANAKFLLVHVVDGKYVFRKAKHGTIFRKVVGNSSPGSYFWENGNTRTAIRSASQRDPASWRNAQNN